MLIAQNAMTYNAPETIYFIDAAKFKEAAIPIMGLAERFLLQNRIACPTDAWPSALCRLDGRDGADRATHASGHTDRGDATFTPPGAKIVWAETENLGYFPARPVDTLGLLPAERRAIPKHVLRTAMKDRKGKMLVQLFDAKKTYKAVTRRATFRSKNNVFAEDYGHLLTREGGRREGVASEQALKRAYDDALAYFASLC